MTNREILVLIGYRNIYMLIPKKRGVGYLKQPLGHHACPLSELAYQIGFDMCGLDGHLEVCTGYIAPNRHQYFIDKAVKPISNLLGYEYRLVTDREFFANHPVQVTGV